MLFMSEGWGDTKRARAASVALKSYLRAHITCLAEYRRWLGTLSDRDLRAYVMWVYDEGRDTLLDYIEQRHPERYLRAMEHELERGLAESDELMRRGLSL